MIIRQETEKDFKEIYSLVKTAFETARVSNGKEQDFVNDLRAGKNYIPELALVAEQDNKIIGHIMLTKFYVNTDKDNKFEALLLAPICVMLEYRNEKIGAGLINKSFELAKNMGYTAVFLVGDPNYYYRFGFQQSTNYNIRNIDNVDAKYVMGCELVKDGLKDITGYFSFY
ncbi:MAG: N-acetyltransferase [Endomicrobiaceae bacterium]|nr:N-acetyltransferase [Endomicrobiaceae bacterium]